jgi:replicative DNA helicase
LYLHVPGLSVGKAELLVAKQRRGLTGVANLLFDGATMRFSDDPTRGRAEAA